MGQHDCLWCLTNPGNYRYSSGSSGDNYFLTDDGITYMFPDMLVHYFEHGYKPPKRFVDDVMNNRIVDGRRLQARSLGQVIRLGYLEPPFDTTGEQMPDGFEGKLFALMQKYDNTGNVKRLLLANRDNNPTR